MKNNTSRRDFIKLVTLASGMIWIPPYLQSCNSCNDTPDIPGLSTMDKADSPFDVWRQMIELLEKSPDHFFGQRKALIASKDPAAMTDFVRENIRLIPKKDRFLRSAYNGVQFGLNGALRSGLATAREKAEILKDMLVEAGFEARVIYEKVEFSENEAKGIVFHSYKQPEFNPPISNEQLKVWQKTLGADASNGEVSKLSNLEEKAEGLIQQFIKEADETGTNYNKLETNFAPPRDNSIPSVAVIIDGEEKYAHVFDPKIPFGELHPKNDKNYFNNADKFKPLNEEVEITLSCSKAFNPKKEIELLKGNWELSDLIGSTVFLQFLNNMNFSQQATMSISQIRNFTPSFSYQKIGTEKEFMQERSFIGEPIDLSANQLIPKNEDGLEFQPIGNTPGNTEKVIELKVEAIPLAFPEVRLEISALDENGNAVEGLTNSNFLLVDNKNQVIGNLNSNVITPKVLLLYDTSLSMPKIYRDEEVMAQFTADIEAMVREDFPHAEFTLQRTDSYLYTTMLKAKQGEYDLIMYATDGDNHDKFNPNYSDVYEAGQPIIILEVLKKHRTYDELQNNIKNLISIPAVDQDLVKAEIKGILSNVDFPPYVMTYHSFGENDEHILNIKLNDKDVSTETTFKFPERNDEYLADRIVGLYLTIKHKGVKTKRTLAGWKSEVYGFQANRAFLDEVHELLLGGLAINFEGEAPSLSIQLTEYLEAMLSNENWLKAQIEGDTENAVKYLEEGVLQYPSLLLSMVQPLENAYTENSLTLPLNFRSCIIKMKPGLYSENTLLSFDYLPTANYHTISKSGDGRDNFIENMKKTMQFAVLESEVFDNSTLKLLENKELISYAKSSADKEFSRSINDQMFTTNLRKRNGHVFFDQSMETAALFTILSASGEVLALLPDGTGGGSQGTARQLKELGRIVKEYNELMSAMKIAMGVSGSGFALGVVATYGATLVELYAYVSEAIILMDADQLGDEVGKALVSLACNIYKDIAYMSLGKVGNGLGIIENLIGMMGGDFSFVPCKL